jgi:hypothetical protein
MTKGFKPTFTITNRITAGLTRIERTRGFLEAATLSDLPVPLHSTADRGLGACEMGRRALILEAHHTTHIEGTRLGKGTWWKRAMPRQARLDAPGTLLHVMIRGMEGKRIFRDIQDRKDFVTRLGDLAK